MMTAVIRENFLKTQSGGVKVATIAERIASLEIVVDKGISRDMSMHGASSIVTHTSIATLTRYICMYIGI